MPTTFNQAVRSFEKAVREQQQLFDEGKADALSYSRADENYMETRKILTHVHDRHQRRFLAERKALGNLKTALRKDAPHG